MPEALKTVFITVGTTKFDDLIRAVDTLEFVEVLKRKGYDKIVVQRGAGAYIPSTIVAKGEHAANTLSNGMQIEVFDFAPSLVNYTTSAALVISHAGSGSIFESLSMGKPLIVVPNPVLMDNHQIELGEHLAALHHLICATPDTLVQAVANLDPSNLKPYSKGSGHGISKLIDGIVFAT